eukprot:CAMPEP_0201490488 /NCGR_PEP_ID=MMETSP0151_2-20130828/26584_1 /ASSEMBLY_ACC=CAM_ASM_000257 /TAXON_ID=200890 /ORGANISM="Paramoeba atlantica, Strain 621/1 / CCAP 1560/9" /LENGTH=205 /DNA_ID=CAMNT_0047876461 /DNA_START=132 /DNA_END=749 /DNA_ORIENTATION=+
MIKLGPGEKTCFFDDAALGERLFLVYDVVRGGDLDVHIDISFEEKSLFNQLYRAEGPQGKFQSSPAEKDGEYRVCFSNFMSTVTDKYVDFQFDVEEKHEHRKTKYSPDRNPLSDLALTEDLKVLEHEANFIESSLVRAERTQKALQHKEKLHFEVSDDSNYRAKKFALIEATILIVIGLMQVYLIRKMFGSQQRLPMVKKRMANA